MSQRNAPTFESCSFDEHTQTHALHFNGHFPGERGLAGCPLNSPSPFIPGLRILLEQV